MQQRIWIAIVAAALGWGMGGVGTRAAFDEGVEPYTLVGFRVLVAVAFVLAFLRIRKSGLPRNAEAWRVGSVMAVANLVAPYVLFTLAYENAGAGFVGLLAALIPVSTALWAHYLLPDEPLHLAKVTGLTIALTGVTVLLLSGDSGIGDEGRPLVAFGLSAAAVVIVGFAGVYAKRHTLVAEPMQTTGVQHVVGAVLALAVMLGMEGTPHGITAAGWGWIVFLGGASTFLPFAIFYWLLRHVSATYASLIGYLVPLIAVVFGVIVLDEEIGPGIVLGGALILAGVLLSDRVESRRRGLDPRREPGLLPDTPPTGGALRQGD